MPAFKDLTGQKFGDWEVLWLHAKPTPSGVKPRANSMWWCRCTAIIDGKYCGKEKPVDGGYLRREGGCGCRKNWETGNRVRTHGESGHAGGSKRSREYEAWAGIKKRCYDPNSHQFKDWGGRGIKMFPGWIDDYVAFRDYVGRRPPGTTIDRWPNPNGDYEPGNVRWATWDQQNNNRRVREDRVFVLVDGVQMTVQDAAKAKGMKTGTLRWRLWQGYSGDELFQPVKSYLFSQKRKAETPVLPSEVSPVDNSPLPTPSTESV